jgi:hypothetical protein
MFPVRLYHNTSTGALPWQYKDWRRYAEEIIRNRRYAFYARTRQWHKLAALEAEQAAAGNGVDREQRDAPYPPRRTSMADVLPPDEVARGARRGRFRGAPKPVVSGWNVYDE